MTCQVDEAEQLLKTLGFEVFYRYQQDPRLELNRNPEYLSSEILSLINRIFPNGLYNHQAIAIDHAIQKENVVICTGTASGKTLAFALPVMQRLLEDNKVRAIFFYPTKALAGDQWQKLQSLAETFGIGGKIYKFDGDTPQKLRHEALKKGRILLCTPDVLHTTMLRRSSEGEYRELFSNLEMVILDECHVYSGAFGSNMAYLLRRLRQVCRRLGTEPQFMAASATSRDPRGHLEKLTGTGFTVVGEAENGSPSGGRDFYLAIPGEYEDDKKIIDIVAELVKMGKRFLVFCHSRRITEQLFVDLVEKYPQVEGLVMPYRSGYEYEDRAKIEAAMRNGSLKGVISTSALELGVDLPEVEFCVLVGIPSTSMSFWQRAGRVGRSPGSRGKVIIIPSANSIDDYYRLHPESIFTREMEDLVIHLDNWQLILAHFACARIESGNFDKPELDEEVFGQDFARLAESINDLDISDDVLISTEPHHMVGIRGIDDTTYEIYTSGGEQRLGTISYSQILREAYPKAVYRHMGEAFRVEWVKSKDRTIRVKRENRAISTSPTGFVIVKERVNNGTVYRKVRWGNAMEMWHSTVAVTTVTNGFRERVNNQWVNQEKYPSPLQRRVVSEGVWFRFGAEFGKLSKNGLNAFAHALSNIFSILHPCDPAEIATHSVVNGKDGNAYIYIFDTTSGGLGITAAVFDYFIDLLDPIKERLETCDHCDSELAAFDKGCPSCIQVPRWYEDNEHLSKNQALELLEKIHYIVNSAEPQINISQAFSRRKEGALTALEAIGKDSDGEIFAENMIYGLVTFSVGSLIALRSGRKGKIISTRFENNQVIYETAMEDGPIILVKNMNGNLTLISGKENLICLSCGEDGIDIGEFVCPVCAAQLK